MDQEIVARVDGKLQLESKKDMKARGVPSPNRADALALTFAYPVQKGEKPGGGPYNGQGAGKAVTEYDPFAMQDA